MSTEKILIVEDEGIIAYRLQEVLEKNNFKVASTVASGEEAIKETYNTNPDLVLMDINLAGEMDGIQAAERIHNDFNVPIVFLTAYGDDNFLTRAKKADPYGYLLKPFNERELVIAVSIAFHKHNNLKNVKLKGILSVCAKCSKIRNEEGQWDEMIEYIVKHSEAKFSHGICPDCAESLYGGLFRR